MKVYIGANPGGKKLGYIFPFSVAMLDYLEAQGVETTLDYRDKSDIALCVSYNTDHDQARVLKDNGAILIHRLDGRSRAIIKNYDKDEVVREVNWLSDWTVFQSEYIRQHTMESVDTLFGEEAPICVDGDRASMIYNGVNTHIFSPEGPRKELKGKINILHVAISPGVRKRASYVCEIAEMLKDNPDIHFYTIGQQDKDLRSGHVFRDGLMPNITHLGPILDQQELAAYMRSATALLFPSVNDYCPNTVLEAMSCGLPVWYDESGGTPELVLDGMLNGGAPIHAGNPLWPLESLIRNHADYRRDAVEIIRRRFTVERMGEEYLSLFQQLLRRFP